MGLLKMIGPNGSDYYQTPPQATALLTPYLKKDWVVWEPAAGRRAIANVLEPAVKRVICTDILDGFDFLTDKPDFEFDCIVTNPPFSKKDQFLARCYQYGKPFALLMPITALASQGRTDLYARYGIQLLIPDRRVNYLPFEYDGGEIKAHSWFGTAWFTWRLLPEALVFVKMRAVDMEEIIHDGRINLLPETRETYRQPRLL